MKSPILKLCNAVQRPFARRVKTIGAWQKAMELMGMVGVMVNCALIGQSGLIERIWPDLSFGGQVVIVIVLEHLILATKMAVDMAIPDVPHWIQIETAKAEHWRREAYKRESKLLANTNEENNASSTNTTMVDKISIRKMPNSPSISHPSCSLRQRSIMCASSMLLQDLPDDILIEIGNCIPTVIDLLQCAQLNRRWNFLINNYCLKTFKEFSMRTIFPSNWPRRKTHLSNQEVRKLFIRVVGSIKILDLSELVCKMDADILEILKQAGYLEELNLQGVVTACYDRNLSKSEEYKTYIHPEQFLEVLQKCDYLRSVTFGTTLSKLSQDENVDYLTRFLQRCSSLQRLVLDDHHGSTISNWSLEFLPVDFSIWNFQNALNYKDQFSKRYPKKCD
uniref:Anoctamin n=1 Tax=Ditylenchus dipsaci TaxID=166011 RepID=A0A915EKW7_9BILA